MFASKSLSKRIIIVSGTLISRDMKIIIKNNEQANYVHLLNCVEEIDCECLYSSAVKAIAIPRSLEIIGKQASDKQR